MDMKITRNYAAYQNAVSNAKTYRKKTFPLRARGREGQGGCGLYQQRRGEEKRGVHICGSALQIHGGRRAGRPDRGFEAAGTGRYL